MQRIQRHKRPIQAVPVGGNETTSDLYSATVRLSNDGGSRTFQRNVTPPNLCSASTRRSNDEQVIPPASAGGEGRAGGFEGTPWSRSRATEDRDRLWQRRRRRQRRLDGRRKILTGKGGRGGNGGGGGDDRHGRRGRRRLFQAIGTKDGLSRRWMTTINRSFVDRRRNWPSRGDEIQPERWKTGSGKRAPGLLLLCTIYVYMCVYICIYARWYETKNIYYLPRAALPYWSNPNVQKMVSLIGLKYPLSVHPPFSYDNWEIRANIIYWTFLISRVTWRRFCIIMV